MSEFLQHLPPSLSVAPFLIWLAYLILRRYVQAGIQPNVTPRQAREHLRTAARAIALLLIAALAAVVLAALLAKFSALPAPASEAHEEGAVQRVSL